MNVGELRKAIEELPDDMLVIVSSDEEGNDFKRLRTVGTDQVFIDEQYGRGYIMYKELTPELKAWGYTEEDVYGYVERYNDETDEDELVYDPEEAEDATECIVLWP